MNPRQRQQHFDASAAARRRQTALLLERLETIQRTPARNVEQQRLKELAIADLLEGAEKVIHRNFACR